jgi:dTDP-4-amino-4,6-dideoxygalactose transaminase
MNRIVAPSELKMNVPLLDVNAQNLPLEEELKAAFERVLRSGRFIMGPEVEDFEAEIAAMVGAKHGIGVSSGTDAILLALMALGIGPGDEVICPSFTFFATAGCVSRVGATPVFADSNASDFNINLDSLRRRISRRTKAIIPVHLFGQSADMDAIMDLAGEHGLAVIEDGAQSLGAQYKGRGCGTIGDFGTYSFFPSKNLGGFGDGGMLVTNDGDMAETARVLRAHGSKPKYYHQLIGGNFRLDPLQAALLQVKIKHYAGYTRSRQRNAEYYTRRLLELEGVGAGEGSAEDGGARVLLPVAFPEHNHIWNQYTLRIIGEGRRDALKGFLTAQGIGCEVYYPVPMHQQVCFADLPGESSGSLPVCERLAAEVISIPIFPELVREQQDRVIEAISRFLEQAH